MNDFEEVLNDLKMLWENLIDITHHDFENSEKSALEIIQNTIDLLEEYNNDRG